MAGTAEEPLLPSWSQGCLVIFLEEELAPDQGVRLQLCRELAGTPAIEKSPGTGECRSSGGHCWCPGGRHSPPRGVVTSVPNLSSLVYKFLSSPQNKTH